MVHLDNFEVKTLPKNFGRPAGEPKQRVYACRVVGSPDHRNAAAGLCDTGPLDVCMACGANDESFFVLSAELGHLSGHFMKTEVDDNVCAGDRRLNIVALVDLPGELKVRAGSNSIEQSLAHAAFVSDDDDVRHLPFLLENAARFQGCAERLAILRTDGG